MRDLIKVKELFDELQSTNSVTEKERILKRHQDNSLGREVLKFILNDFIVTGISTKKINKKIDVDIRENQMDVTDIMSYLKINNTGSDLDIKVMQQFIESQSEVCQDLAKGIVCKDIKLGLSAKTYNKAFKDDTIPVFDVMLAKKYDDHKSKVTGNQFVITKKLDGNRVVVIKHDGKVKSFTRQGREYVGLQEIESDIQNLPYDNIVFDGELLSDAAIESTQELFANTLKKARAKTENKTGLVFHIFDVIDYEDFIKGKSKDKAIDRKARLHDIFSNNDLPHCTEVTVLYTGYDVTKIDELLQYALSQGWEGIMVNLDSPYECKRTDQILKVKVMDTCDLRIIDFEEGTGKYQGILGSLILDYKGNRLGCGSGFSDADRTEIWYNKDKYIGKICEVQYFEESKNQDGTVSLRFPVYKGIREDKDKPSYN